LTAREISREEKEEGTESNEMKSLKLKKEKRYCCATAIEKEIGWS
jgi:hypothetical protein